MARWRIQMLGPLVVLRDGEPIKFRTRHQGLLVARLAGHAPKSIDRAETAELLWPEALAEHQSAYLRRAIMELRRLGFELEADRDRVALSPESFTTDLIEESDADVLDGIEHPIAYEIRGMARRRRESFAKRSSPGENAVVRTDSDLLLMWIGQTLIVEHPEVAIEMLAKHGPSLIRSLSPEPLLTLFLRALSVTTRPSENRTWVTSLAAAAALLLTKYGMAERLASQCVEESRMLGDRAQESRSLSMLAFLWMEKRRWEDAVKMGQQATVAAIESGNLRSISSTHNNLAGIQWHMLRFEEAMANYKIAYETPTDEGSQRMALGNAALVSGLYVTPLWTSLDPPDVPFSASGQMVMGEVNICVGYGLIYHDPRFVSRGASRLLMVAGEGSMERLFCVALDYAAYAFSRLQRPTEAAVCVRLGTKLRFAVGHRRSPAEKLALRLHPPGPLFGREIEALLDALNILDLAKCAEWVTLRLSDRR